MPAIKDVVDAYGELESLWAQDTRDGEIADRATLDDFIRAPEPRTDVSRVRSKKDAL